VGEAVRGTRNDLLRLCRAKPCDHPWRRWSMPQAVTAGDTNVAYIVTDVPQVWRRTLFCCVTLVAGWGQVYATRRNSKSLTAIRRCYVSRCRQFCAPSLLVEGNAANAEQCLSCRIQHRCLDFDMRCCILIGPLIGRHWRDHTFREHLTGLTGPIQVQSGPGRASKRLSRHE
jgi:hypothetical protein